MTIPPFVKRLEGAYRRLFSIEEIEREPTLQWMFGASLLFFLLAFDRWISSSVGTIEQAERGSAVCWEYFQECTKWYFLHEPGNGYSQSLFYMALYGILIAIVYFIWKKQWTRAHALLALLFLWEIIVTFLFSFSTATPYYYYHIILTAVLLFVPHKEFFLKLSFVFLYFMSVTVKLDPTWILGTYFSALRDGLPLFPDALIAPITNLVIFMQMIGAWFLLSRNWLLQRGAFLFFLAFHLYSGVFVFYLYPSVSLPALIILFGPAYRYTPIPFKRTAIAGAVIIVLVALFQLVGFLAPGDRRITLEGNKFGMFMFEANHQCVVSVSVHTKGLKKQSDWEAPDGMKCSDPFCLVQSSVRSSEGETVRSERYESGRAWYRCYPYEWWTRLNSRCDNDSDITRISLSLDHSINGGPFYRTVNEEDICSVPYKAFGDNDWIKEQHEAPLIGYPVSNTYN